MFFSFETIAAMIPVALPRRYDRRWYAGSSDNCSISRLTSWHLCDLLQITTQSLSAGVIPAQVDPFIRTLDSL
jgi:hypothetical protein